MSRFMCYLWEDLDNPGEVKFGDHWVEGDVTYDEAVEHTRKYVRGSLARLKLKYDDGRIVIHEYWDASIYANDVGCFKKHGKVDDKIRHAIGRHIQADWHKIDADSAIEKINEELDSIGRERIVAGLSPNQYNAAVNVLEAFEEGKQTVLAELCARFGKTIWAGAVTRESEAQLTIVATYVQTVSASFKKDFGKFAQFENFVQVDTKDDNYQEKIQAGLKAGKQVIAYLSVCQGTKRQERIDFLFGQDVTRTLFVDEADFGAHKPKQAQALIDARQDSDRVILMTGTNADKAASMWHVDHMLSVTYPELLMEKNLK